MIIFEKLAQMNMKSIGNFQENKEYSLTCSENTIENVGVRK
jgi:hypothetical protein